MSFVTKLFDKSCLQAQAKTAKAADGWILENSVIWGDWSKETPLAVGMSLPPWPVDFLTPSDLNTQRANVQTLLSSVNAPEYLQITYTVSSDYSDLGEAYAKIKRPAAAPLDTAHRAMWSGAMEDGMEQATAKRININAYLGTLIDATKPTGEFHDSIISTQRDLSDRLKRFSQTLCDTEGKPMDSADIYTACRRHLTADFWEGDNKEAMRRLYRPGESIFESCSMADYFVDKDGYLRVGNKFRGIVLLRDYPPEQVRMDSMLHVLDVLPHGAQVIATYIRKDVSEEVAALQKEITKYDVSLKFKGNATSDSEVKARQREEDARAELQQRVDELTGKNNRGAAKFPVYVFYAFVLTADTKEELNRTTELVRSRLNAGGFRSYTISHPTGLLKASLACLPGKHPASVKEWFVYAYHTYAGEIVPMHGHDTHGVSDPHVVLQASPGFIGLPLFAGGIPLNLLVTGMPRSGKSQGMVEFLLQLYGLSKFTCIIESSGGYTAYTHAFGGMSFTVNPGAPVCFPYLDTSGEFLDQMTLSDAAGVIRAVMGTIVRYSDQEIAAGIQETLHIAYTAKVKSFWNKNDGMEQQCYMEAFLFSRFMSANPRLSEAECFKKFRKEVLETDEASKQLDAIAEDEAQLLEYGTFKAKRDNLWFVVCYSASKLKGEDALRNKDVVKYLETLIPLNCEENLKRLLSEIRLTLKQWTRTEGGSRGGLIDGTAEECGFDLNAPVVHFDIQTVGDDPDYRRIAMFAIAAMIRRNIYSLPRNTYKILYVDELYNMFANFEGGAALIKKSLAEWQKYGVLFIGATQNLEQMFEVGATANQEAEIKSRKNMLSLFNAHLMFRQENITVANFYTEMFSMPSEVANALLGMQDPTKLPVPPKEKYAEACFFTRYQGKSICTRVQFPLMPITFFLGMSNAKQAAWLKATIAARRGLYNNYQDFVIGEAERLWNDEAQLEELFRP